MSPPQTSSAFDPDPRQLATESAAWNRHKPAEIPLLKEKLEIVSSLLLRAGVPNKIIREDDRAQAVLDNLALYLRHPISQMLHRYDIGRQFITRGGVREANEAAEIVLPLLLAQTSRELMALTRPTEDLIAQEILPINVLGPKVDIPKR